MASPMEQAVQFEAVRPSLEVIQGGLGAAAVEPTVEAPFAGDPRNGTVYEVQYDDSGNIVRSTVDVPGSSYTVNNYTAKGEPMTTIVTDYKANTLATTYHQNGHPVTITDVYRGGMSQGWVSHMPERSGRK